MCVVVEHTNNVHDDENNNNMVARLYDTISCRKKIQTNIKTNSQKNNNGLFIGRTIIIIIMINKPSATIAVHQNPLGR